MITFSTISCSNSSWRHSRPGSGCEVLTAQSSIQEIKKQELPVVNAGGTQSSLEKKAKHSVGFSRRAVPGHR